MISLRTRLQLFTNCRLGRTLNRLETFQLTIQFKQPL